MTRVVNKSNDRVAPMNHRCLKDQMREAAALGKRSSIHGHNPITAYAYGAEIERRERREISGFIHSPAHEFIEQRDSEIYVSIRRAVHHPFFYERASLRAD